MPSWLAQVPVPASPISGKVSAPATMKVTEGIASAEGERGQAPVGRREADRQERQRRDEETRSGRSAAEREPVAGVVDEVRDPDRADHG